MNDDTPNPSVHLPEDEGAIVPAGRGEILLYQTDDGRTRVECRFQDDTIWLSQAMMAELFQKDVRTITDKLRNSYEENEQEQSRVVKEYLTTELSGNTG